MANPLTTKLNELLTNANSKTGVNDTTLPSAVNRLITGYGVGTAPNIQINMTVIPSETKQTIYADSGYDGMNPVVVNAISNTYVGSGVTKKSAQTYTPTTTDQTISSGVYLNGIQTIKGDSALVSGNIKSGVSIFGVSGTYTGAGGPTISLQDRTVTPELTSQTITADSGYTGLGTVTVNAIPNQKTSTDVTVSGKTVTVPVGYYSTQVQKSVADGALADITVSTSGLITASVGTAGYIVTGASTQKTKQLTTKGTDTITPTTSEQTAVASGVYTTGAIKVAAIPSQYKNTSTGNITAADVVKDKIGFNSSGSVTGTLVINKYYTGPGAPSNGTGNNGDIYIQTS